MVDLLDAYIDKLKEDYIKLEEENKQLEEQHDLLIDEFQKEREKLCKQIKQESDARERFVKKVKQLKEQLDKKDKEIGELKSVVYIVKRPQGSYEDYREEIEKVFLNKEKAEKYVEEENAKLPLEQRDKCSQCTWRYKIGCEHKLLKPDCLEEYRYGICPGLIRCQDVYPLVVEEYEVKE